MFIVPLVRFINLVALHQMLGWGTMCSFLKRSGDRPSNFHCIWYFNNMIKPILPYIF